MKQKNAEKERNIKNKRKEENKNNSRIKNGSNTNNHEAKKANNHAVYHKNKPEDSFDFSSEIQINNNNIERPKKEKLKYLIIIISMMLILVIGLIVLFTVKPWAKKGKDKDKDTTAEDEPSNIKTDKPIENNDPENTSSDKSSEKSDIIQDKDNEESDIKQEKEKESDEASNIEEITSEPEPEETYIIVENPKIKRIKIDKKTRNNILVEGMNQTKTLYRKNIYDVSTYKEYSSGKENDISYSKKMTYSILLLKECLNTENEIEDCDFDENDTLRHLENNEEKICIFNITDTYIILSVKCSLNVDEIKKTEIISDLNYMKYFLSTETSDNGNLDSENKTELCGYNCIKDVYTIKHNDSVHEIISWKNKTLSSDNAYKIKEEILIDHKIKDKIESFYQNVFEMIDFNNIEKINISDKDQNKNNDNENDENNNDDNYNEVIIFNEEILDSKFILKNRIVNKNGKLKAYLILSINNQEKNIEYLSKTIDISELKTYKSDIIKINYLGKLLSENIKEKLENITIDILNNCNDLNEKIYYKNIEEIINSLEMKSSPNYFINKLDLTKNKLDSISGSISQDINPYTERLNTNITKYTQESIELINNISENIKQLTNLLGSQVNIFTRIANYYLNDTSISYFDIIEKANNIFTEYYRYQKESINEQIQEMLNKFQNNIEIENKIKDLNYYKYYFNLELTDINNIDTSLNSSKNKIDEIKENIKEEIENKIIRKENGYYISANEIEQNSNKYTQIFNSAYDTIVSLNNLDIIDKTFDEIMIGFKDNFTALLRYLEDEKNTQFPLEEDILKDGLFSPEEKQKIKNIMEELGNNVTLKIKQEQNKYLDNIQREVEKLSNNENGLYSFIINLTVLCSNESLQELSDSFEYAFMSYLQAIKNDIKLTIDNYLKYINDKEKILEKLGINNENDNVEKISVTKKFQKLKNIKEYIENSDNLVSELSEEFIDISNKITEIIIKIRNAKLNNKYKEISDLSFINENINEVNILYERIPSYFSKNIFENKYKPKLGEIITKIKNDINAQFSSIESLDVINKCDDEELYIRLKSGEYCINIFDETNEEINFNNIYSDNYFKRFKNKLNEFYISLNESIYSYNSQLEIAFSSLNQIEEQNLNNNMELNLDFIENKIDSLLSEKFGSILIKNCYNYYQTNTNKSIDDILNEFSNKINITYDNFKNEIIQNQAKFKYCFNEFSFMASIYENIISQNITKIYFDSIIDIQRINFNYSISFYYNYLTSLINSLHNNIIYNMPFAKNGLNINSEEYKTTINNKFIELIEKVKDSKNYYMRLDRQTNILGVPRTNFFKVNSIVSTNILRTRNLIRDRVAEISAIQDDNEITENSLLSRFYLENSNSAKLIKDFYLIIYNDRARVLNHDKFKEIIVNNFDFNKNKFINKINELLNDLNIERNQYFLKLREKMKKEIDEEISDYITNENKEGILDKIVNLYNQFKFSDSQKNEIYDNIDNILSKITEYMNREKERIKQNQLFYKNDYSFIENKLSEYKNEIIINIENKINEVVNNYGNDMIDKVYNNKVKTDLNYYIDESKKFNSNENEILLNSSYNYGEIILKINENIVNKYKELVKKTINYRNKVKLMDILNIDDIKQIINNKIDNEYNNSLLPTLKNYIRSSENDPNYDFDSTINDDIKSTITLKLNDIEDIINSLRNSNQISIDNFPTLNINKILQKNLYLYNSSFKTFISSSKNNENLKLNQLFKSMIISEFDISFNHTISSFGNDFFERYMKYNKISKIDNFYQNFRYSLVETLLYYQIIYTFKSNAYNLPKDLIKEIHNLNYMNEKLNDKTDEIIAEVNKQITYFEEIVKNEIIENYISNIKNDAYIKSKFDTELISRLNNVIENYGKNEYFEENYYKIIKNSLNEHFSKVFEKEMKEGNNASTEIFGQLKKEIIVAIPDNGADNNEELNNIKLKANETAKNIDKYSKNYNYSFKISDEISNELSQYYNQKLYDCFSELVQIINNEKKNLGNKLDNEISSIENNLNYEDFNIMADNRFSNITKNIINITENINIFSNNLNNRKLDDKLINNEQGILLDSNAKTDNFLKILSCSEKNKIFITTYEFNNKLDILINNYNSSYKNSLNLIENGNYQEDIKEYILSNLTEINDKILNYYKKINETLFNLKTKLINSIDQLDTLLKEEYQNENNLINFNINLMKEKLEENKNKNQDVHKLINSTNYFYNEDYLVITTIIDDKEYFFNLYFEDNIIYNPNIKVNLNSKVRPKKMEIEIILDSAIYKIYLTFDFNNVDNPDINKYIIDVQLFDIDSNTISKDDTCNNYCSKIKSFEYKQNGELNLLN